MAKETNLTLIYDGGLASDGTLHFYEYGRASYAFARLVTTLEIFRRTDRIPERVSSGNYVDMLVKAPEKGSFPIEILVPLAAEAAKYTGVLSSVPLGVLLKYVVQLVKGVLPKSENTVIELAKLRLEKEKERTKQSKQETDRTKELRRIVESGNATTQQALSLVNEALSDKDYSRKKGINREEIEAIKSEYEEQAAIETDIEKYKSALEKIDNKKLVKLASKVRPQIQEIGLPLRRSATIMKLRDRDGGSTATFSRTSIDYINDRIIDKEETTTELRMFAYDRDTGYGKCDINDLGLTRIPFFVPIDVRSRMRKKILNALDKDAVLATVKFIRNRDKTITSVLLADVLPPDEL